MNTFFNKTLLIIVSIILFMSVGYSVLNRNLKITGELVYHPKADIRITNIMPKTLNNATIQYARFSKKEIILAYNAASTSSSVTFTVEVTNYTDMEMAIFKIDGLNDATIDGYVLKDKLKNEDGVLKVGDSTTFTITFRSQQIGIQQVLLDFDFEPIYKVTYEGFNDTSDFKTEVIKNDVFVQYFGVNAPDRVKVTMNEKILTPTYSNKTITIPNVDGNIKIQAIYTPTFTDSCEVHPNAPELNGDMIPVVYDEYEESWLKQDLDKSYDYCNQIWANAVTVIPDQREAIKAKKVGEKIPMEYINTMWC